jgi:hypothetical protein
MFFAPMKVKVEKRGTQENNNNITRNFWVSGLYPSSGV